MSVGSTTRTTQRSLTSRVQGNLQRNMAAMGRIQDRLSSGKEISRPSDSPTGTVSALRLRSEIRRNEQYTRNADDGLGWLGTADNTLTETLATVRRARDLALQGNNGATSATDRAALAAEVEQLREHALSLANTTYLSTPIFGGTAAGTTAYSATGAYLGDAGSAARTVGAGIEVQVSIPGEEVFGTAPADLFGVLDRLASSLRTDPAGLTADIDAIDGIFLNVQDKLAAVGARYHQVEAMRDRAEATMSAAKGQLANVESIDLPATIMELQLQEVAYQAALGAASRVLQPSLVDFLR
jgi:flagellar hook-associated protein 3 FlgL